MTIHNVAGFRIATTYSPPPIPGWEELAWVAYDDRRGADDSPHGYGATEQDAIKDLLEQMDAAL